MKIFQADIEVEVFELLEKLVNTFPTYSSLNREIEERFGIIHFFDSPEDYLALKNEIKSYQMRVATPNPVEYGDFQTPVELSEKICQYLLEKSIRPSIIIEPTCGRGSFVISALKYIGTIEKIYGIEIYKPYIWETKFRIIQYYLKSQGKRKPKICLFHQSIFDFNFREILKPLDKEDILVLGNPPWVTNSILGTLNSDNLPMKSNFKSHSGMDAITGKGNFDIAEYITLSMLENFSSYKGHMAFLVKNIVIKNIMHDLHRNRYKIANLEKLTINAGNEFNAAVDASVFYCDFNIEPSFQCVEKDFYTYKKKSKGKAFGWVDNNFVSDIDGYLKNKTIEGKSHLEWRSGLKHDCSSVVELKKSDIVYMNKLGEKVELEEDIIYEFLKSSDLQKAVITNSSKYILVTQERVGQDTDYIKEKYPLTYSYLNGKDEYFLKRKSSIYKDKPRFSIFGVGEYSFKKYKVAISGLYKKSKFSLVAPTKPKPIQLDDTCYFLGFDELCDAIYTFLLLNHRKTLAFLKSLVFLDMKRVYTKDILMRIDLKKAAEVIRFDEIMDEASTLPQEFKETLSESGWDSYSGKLLSGKKEPIQLKLF